MAGYISFDINVHAWLTSLQTPQICVGKSSLFNYLFPQELQYISPLEKGMQMSVPDKTHIAVASQKVSICINDDISLFSHKSVLPEEGRGQAQ